MNHIDTTRFCKEASTLAGSLGPEALPRLAQEVMPATGFAVDWQAQGAAPDGLRLSLKTQLQMRCQRCLGALEESIDVAYAFRFVKDEAAAQTEDEQNDEVDHLVHSKQFDLLELIEDEMLMALPFVSLHEACPVQGAAAFMPKEEKPNPFAALAGLKCCEQIDMSAFRANELSAFANIRQRSEGRSP